VIGVPVVNIFGLLLGTRNLPDLRDLNRSFPGSMKGSLASQLAHMFVETVVKRCEFGIDLHTGASGRANLPQIRCDLDEPRAYSTAMAFGVPIAIHAALRDGSLRATSRKLGIPVLVYEGGEALRLDETSVSVGTRGVFRTLMSLGMIEETPDFADVPYGDGATKTCRFSTWIRSTRGGLAQMEVDLGEFVDQRDVLATIFDASGNYMIKVRSRVPGLVIGVEREALVHRGRALAHVAVLDRSADAAPNGNSSSEEGESGKSAGASIPI